MPQKLAAQAARFVKKGLTGYDASYAVLARKVKGRPLKNAQGKMACI